MVPLFSQPAILDDWKAASVTAVASPAGGPTVITTANPHGLVTGMYVAIHGATASGSNGQWVNLNTQQEVYLRMTLSSAGTLAYVSDTTRLEPTTNSTWELTTGGDCVSGITQNNEYVSISGFPSNRTATLNGRGLNSTTASPHCPEAAFWGPTTRPSGYAVTSVPYHWQITVTSPTTFTIPLDSSTFGSFAGETVFYERASLYASQPVRFYKTTPDDGSPAQQDPTANGTQQFVIDGCSSKSNAMTCSLGYNDPDNQKGYGDWAASGSLVVSGGTGTITFTSSFGQSTTSNTRTFQANELAWLWNFNEAGSSLPFGTINRPWGITSITGSPQTLTFANMGCSGPNPGQGAGSSSSLGQCVPDGTYPVITASHNFFFPIFSDYYAYWQGYMATSGCTPAAYAKTVPGNEFPSHVVLSYGSPYTTTFNRLRLWFQWGNTFSGFPMELGTYTCQSSGGVEGPHGYSTVAIDAYAGEWQVVEYTAYPDHWEGGPTSGSYGDVPQGSEPNLSSYLGYPGYDGAAYHYFDYMHVYYVNGSSIAVAPGAQTGQFGPIYYDTVSAEPDEWTPTRSVTYNPATGKYHIAVTIPGTGSYTMPNGTQAVTYDFYHSTSNIKTIGLNNATYDGSAVSAQDGANSTIEARLETSAAALAGTMYVGIVPHMIASGLSSGTSGNVSISFRADPNMQVGDHVTTSGFGLNTAANFSTATAISAVQPRQYWWLTTPGTSNPGQLTSIVVTSGSPNVCTVNLTVVPNVFAGEGMSITGATSGGPGASEATGASFFTISGVSGDSFTFNCPGTTAGTYSTSNTTSCSHCLFGVMADPFVTFNVTNSGNWDGNFTGTMVTAETQKNFAQINFTPPTGVCQFATTTLPNAHIGTAYSQPISMLGCAAPVFSVSAGSLPAWASLNSSTGVVTGTPTGATPTTSSFTVAASDAHGNPTQVFSLTTDTLPVFSTVSPLPAAIQGSAYSETLVFAAGDTPITCTATGVPAGLSLSSSCVLSGTPTTSGTATINVTASNSSGDTQAAAPTAFALTINPTLPAACPGTVCIQGQVKVSGPAKIGH